MGAMKQQATARREGPRAKQSGIDWDAVKTANSAAGVTWDEATPSKALRLVDLATRRGMGVSFSATANGRGVSITFLDGGARPKYYANSPEELDELLDALLMTFGE